jgi:hypothetical protein
MTAAAEQKSKVRPSNPFTGALFVQINHEEIIPLA